MSDKQIALELIRQLPEWATLDEIERGATVPHEQGKRELAEWLSK